MGGRRSPAGSCKSPMTEEHVPTGTIPPARSILMYTAGKWKPDSLKLRLKTPLSENNSLRTAHLHRRTPQKTGEVVVSYSDDPRRPSPRKTSTRCSMPRLHKASCRKVLSTWRSCCSGGILILGRDRVAARPGRRRRPVDPLFVRFVGPKEPRSCPLLSSASHG
jgi:hypothetical protein